MKKNRLEAFSDGVIAIIITIMVLELKPPEAPEISELLKSWHTWLGYVLSFAHVGIYWNNHHHMVSTIDKVNGKTLWANLHLLFWLSLVPFVTSWMGKSQFSAQPVALYGFVFLMCGFSYFLLQQEIIKNHDKDHILTRAIGKDWKGKMSLGAYVSAILVSKFAPLVAFAIYVLVAIIWFLPDPRIEKLIEGD